ncbi:50S ribosomal protein L24 [Buchnera aphidicola (Thelaxes californica)]|uniref:Large ribosomal subunit protein uL24 n=1 Tax=Buchnera aphidicola (Thelaxes californica) TaxID=1315998 RepID=A0A4D6YAP0_9GAMM|nr:50S ribosomal protein L24 [Buchnera aphidicola]QCI26917.1 50S ribosomal protein L24 [Buchnera aphidicola (Thelaxes californica)]
MASKIRKNDKVMILSGKDKGKIGIVLRIINNSKILVEGINMVNKHKKSIPEKNQIGSIIRMESPIHVSNVGLFNEKINKFDRIGFRFVNGKKVRFFKSNKEIVQ